MVVSSNRAVIQIVHPNPQKMVQWEQTQTLDMAILVWVNQRGVYKRGPNTLRDYVLRSGLSSPRVLSSIIGEDSVLLCWQDEVFSNY